MDFSFHLSPSFLWFEVKSISKVTNITLHVFLRHFQSTMNRANYAESEKVSDRTRSATHCMLATRNLCNSTNYHASKKISNLTRIECVSNVSHNIMRSEFFYAVFWKLASTWWLANYILLSKVVNKHEQISKSHNSDHENNNKSNKFPKFV